MERGKAPMARGVVENASDRLSSLPDSMLSHILSFVPTKHAVATSVLSTRWRNLYALVPNIDLDDSFLSYVQDDKQKKEDMLRSFTNFADRVLSSDRKVGIERFSLKCREWFDISRVCGWILAALGHGVQELDLSIPVFILPSEIFACRTLVVLKLGAGFYLEVPSFASFPSLKTLYLDKISFSDESFNNLLACCTVLEDLFIRGLSWDYMTRCHISVPTLKRLSIGWEKDAYRCARSVSFDTPNLVCLHYSDNVADRYGPMNMVSLVEAYIDLSCLEKFMRTRTYGGNGEPLPHNSYAAELIRGISNVRSLYLTAATIEGLPMCCLQMPVFHNLKYLFIESGEDSGWLGLPILLMSSPNLETLVFDGLFRGYSFPCVRSSSLKTIEILSFNGQEREVQAMECFLVTARALERMVIYTHIGWEQLLRIGHRLTRVPASCKIEVKPYFCAPSTYAIDPRLQI